MDEGEKQVWCRTEDSVTEGIWLNMDEGETGMVPTRKDDLRKMVTQTTIETYEELTPQLIQLIEKTKRDDALSESQKQDEISLHLLGYVKSCTNEIIVEVLAEILGLQ